MTEGSAGDGCEVAGAVREAVALLEIPANKQELEEAQSASECITARPAAVQHQSGLPVLARMRVFRESDGRLGARCC